MVFATLSVKDDYWDDFELQDDDIEFLYAHLLDTETPLTPQELIASLVEDRIQREIKQIEEKRLAGGNVYVPQEKYALDEKVVFPALDWRQAEVIGSRDGHNPDMGDFSVIKVRFDNGEEREFASGLEEHPLNNPHELAEEADGPPAQSILEEYEDILVERLEYGLNEKDDFVYIAGRWFPRALLVDVNTGHLNLAEAVLDMSGGGPVTTTMLIDQVELPSNENPKLVEFSLDLALQDDPRFDEVGPAGKVLWYLRRLEPESVREIPDQLRYREVEYDRDILTPEMLALESRLDDELSPFGDPAPDDESVLIHLLYPHWRVGALPLTHRVRSFFPTAYDTPRILFTLVDGDSGEKIPGWVVREGSYVIGLEDWYRKHELMPGSSILVMRGKQPGEVIVKVEAQRSRRDWVRTVLVGADGGVVFATLKQVVSASYDERMGIMVPDVNALDSVWKKRKKHSPPFERVVADVARELTKLNPQNHVHVTELYAAVNLVRRVPPGPIMALLDSRPWFVHVGDLHFRFDDSAGS
ncbi:MAG: hypothetical protein ISR58_14340 [Anaerolineales bacterium]|nr:hypothetical protein [Chloroflexota bacterium]MBL6982355.1 hypothetical protein [Anaerolineales bacterium]